MFIRKRTQERKDGMESDSYQAVESYRKNGKVRQRVVSLGEFSNPESALRQELKYLEKAQEELDVPISDYKEITWTSKWGLRKLAVPIKEAEKRRQKILERYRQHQKRVGLLESVAGRCQNEYASDTTFSEMRQLELQEKKAIANLREIRELIKES